MKDLALEGKVVRLARKTTPRFDFAGEMAHLQSLYYHDGGLGNFIDVNVEFHRSCMLDLKWRQRKVFHKLLLHEGYKDLAEYFEQRYLIPNSLKETA